MSQQLFQSACAAMWGPQYRSEAARRLGVSLRSVMRYDAAETPVPTKILSDLASLLDLRRTEAAELRAALREEVKRRKQETPP